MTEWTRFARCEDVPEGTALNYLTLLALHFDQMVSAFTGLAVKSIRDLIVAHPDCLTDDVMLKIREHYCISVGNYKVEGAEQWKATLGEHRVYGVGSPAEAVKRCLISSRFEVLQIQVPSELCVLTYEQWRRKVEKHEQHLIVSDGHRSGKTAMITDMLERKYATPWGIHESLVRAAEELDKVEPAPEGYLERLRTDVTHTDPELEALFELATLAAQRVDVTPRKVMIVGAGAQGAQLRHLLEGLKGVEVLDYMPQLTAGTFRMDEPPLQQIPAIVKPRLIQVDHPYRNLSNRKPKQYLVNKTKVKSERKAAKAARKQQKRGK